MVTRLYSIAQYLRICKVATLRQTFKKLFPAKQTPHWPHHKLFTIIHYLSTEHLNFNILNILTAHDTYVCSCVCLREGKQFWRAYSVLIPPVAPTLNVDLHYFIFQWAHIITGHILRVYFLLLIKKIQAQYFINNPTIIFAYSMYLCLQ